MAKTYKELAADMARRSMDSAGNLTSSVIDAAVYAPAHAVETVQNIRSTMTTKAEVIATTIEAKMMLQDYMMKDIEASEFAYRLSQNENLRKTMNQLTQQILQPTPVEAAPSRKDNPFIDIGAGLSAYWAEMQKKLPIEIETASDIENVLMSINAGLDKDLEPDTRKLFLKEAGMTTEQVKEFVPIQDYVSYENKVKDTVRLEVMSELGLTNAENLSEQEQLLIESLSEDRMMNVKLQGETGEASEAYAPTYEDVYGVSAQDMYEMFGTPPSGPKDEQPMLDGDDVPADDLDWSSIMELSGAEEGYWDMMEGTIDANMEMLRDLEAQEAAMRSDIGLTEADLSFAGEPLQMDYGDAPDFGISEADLAFARQFEEQMDMEQ